MNFSYRKRMGKVEKISIALPPDMIADVKAAVEQGEYATTSEVIRDALRDWRLKRKIEALDAEGLRLLVQEGIESGPSLDAETAFAHLRAKYRSRQKGR
jgi:antitoxin ParD1/3/4